MRKAPSGVGWMPCLLIRPGLPQKVANYQCNPHQRWQPFNFWTKPAQAFLCVSVSVSVSVSVCVCLCVWHPLWPANLSSSACLSSLSRLCLISEHSCEKRKGLCLLSVHASVFNFCYWHVRHDEWKLLRVCKIYSCMKHCLLMEVHVVLHCMCQFVCKGPTLCL